MKDKQGNAIKAGDILIELEDSCGTPDKDGYDYDLKIWEMPSEDDGSGYVYDIDGMKRRYRWASIEESIKIDMSIMPDGFEYSFRYGMSDIACKIEQGTVLELIENSNWKKFEVKKEEVERFEFMKNIKIETMEDIIDNIDELVKTGRVPHEIVTKVLDIVGNGRTQVRNGEIGIAGMYDQMAYRTIIKTLKNQII
jgi:hypothetical protein